jgi:hypothetical protein
MIQPKALTAILFALAAPLASAQSGYLVKTLQYPQSYSTYLSGINNNNVAAGTYYDQSGVSHGFEFLQGTYTAIDVPDASGTWTSGLNDAEKFTGYYHSVNGTEGYWYLQGTLLRVEDGTETVQLLGINNASDMVGYTTPSVTSTTASGVSILRGKIQSIALPGAANTWVTGINDSSEMVGYAGMPGSKLEAFTYLNGTFTTYRYAGATQTVFNGINSLGVIVGYEAGSSAIPAGFVYSGGVYSPFSIAKADYTVPQGINNAGVIVGYYEENGVIYGFIAFPK